MKDRRASRHTAGLIHLAAAMLEKPVRVPGVRQRGTPGRLPRERVRGGTGGPEPAEPAYVEGFGATNKPSPEGLPVGAAGSREGGGKLRCRPAAEHPSHYRVEGFRAGG